MVILGAQKLARVRENSNFFRSELQKMGFEVLGDNDSPVMPIMLYNPAKIPAFSRECLRQDVSIVGLVCLYVMPASLTMLANDNRLKGLCRLSCMMTFRCPMGMYMGVHAQTAHLPFKTHY